MISLLGSLLGFGTSFLPSVMGFFEKKQANKQELLMLEAKAKYASELSKLKHFLIGFVAKIDRFLVSLGKMH